MALISMATLAASLAFTASLRTVARRCGAVDRPDGCRKLHDRPIPLWGGVAVYCAAVLGLTAVRLFCGAASIEFVEMAAAWTIAAGFVCFVGALDDRFDMPAKIKLLLQIVSVLPIIILGHYVDRIVVFGHPLELGWLGVPLTILWLVGCINALNLIDGMDGLASIVGLSTMAMMGMVAANEGHPQVALMAIILASSLFGFLAYNLPPASIFLGDSGSMVIGLSVGFLGMQGGLKTTATLGITAPAVIMTLPMFDIVAAVVRRKLTGKHFDTPDRLHIHHRLLDRGWTPWQVLCLIGAVCLTTGAAATAATILRRDILAWVTAMSLVVLMIRLRLFGHDEFALVKAALLRLKRYVAGIPSRLAFAKGAVPLPATPRLRILESAFAGNLGLEQEYEAENPNTWNYLLNNVREWNIHRVEFQSSDNGQFRRVRWIDPAVPAVNDCRWSHAVSVPSANGALCELRVVGKKSITTDGELAALTSLLRTFGAHFAAHPELIFGPAANVEDTNTAAPHSDEHRKAA